MIINKCFTSFNECTIILISPLFFEYGVGGEDDELYEDDDPEGSRAICSRTRIGIKGAFLKEFPSYTEKDYLTRLSIPKIAIMLADQPRVIFKNNKKDKVKFTEEELEACAKENEVIMRKFIEKQKEKLSKKGQDGN